MPALIRVIRETHKTPASVEERVARAGGLNRFGEPNFRVVWGGSRLAWIGGRWTDRDAHGNVIRESVELRRVPKYVPLDRWHLERWMPPEAYGSPEGWYTQTVETEDGIRVPALGPYPSRGEYEHCFTLEGSRGEFVPLSPAANATSTAPPTRFSATVFLRRSPVHRANRATRLRCNTSPETPTTSHQSLLLMPPKGISLDH